MCAAMAGFALEDMGVKEASETIPVGEALIIYGAIGALIFAVLSTRKGQSPLHPAMFSPVMLLRSVCEIGGRLFYALAIALTPLSNASAILQMTPLLVALGAIIFFGEKITTRRWCLIAAGFIGVLLILQPGLDGFQPSAIFAVLGTLGFAARALATRAAPVSMSSSQLGVLGFSMLTLAGVVLLCVSGGAMWPTLETSAFLLISLICGLIGYQSLTIAMRTGSISVVSPFRYTRLVFGILLGALVFSESPDALSLIGSVIIVVSGIALLQPKHS